LFDLVVQCFLPFSWYRSEAALVSQQAQTNVNKTLLAYQNDTRLLGAILYDSIAQNQSYAVAEAIRWALLPLSSDYTFPTSPEYAQLSANLGAATAYAMDYAYVKVSRLQHVSAPRLPIRVLPAALCKSCSSAAFKG
jgi:uncharacterized membrane protein YpjA